MPRLTYAAQSLIEQVQERSKRAKAEPVGEPDGLDVYRTISFDKTTSKWLAKVLPHLNDPRIVGFDTEDGVTVVEFSPRATIADIREPFALDAAEVVAENSNE